MTAVALMVTADELRAIIREELRDAIAPRPPEVLDCRAAGELAGYCASAMRAFARKGEVPAKRVAGKWRFRRADVLAWVSP